MMSRTSSGPPVPAIPQAAQACSPSASRVVVAVVSVVSVIVVPLGLHGEEQLHHRHDCYLDLGWTGTPSRRAQIVDGRSRFGVS